jgi:hypothetical protein
MEAARHHHDDEIRLEVGAAVRRPAAEILLEQRHDGVRELLAQRPAGAGRVAHGGGVGRMDVRLGHLETASIRFRARYSSSFGSLRR